jgi:hypothetical protein
MLVTDGVTSGLSDAEMAARLQDTVPAPPPVAALPCCLIPGARRGNGKRVWVGGPRVWVWVGGAATIMLHNRDVRGPSRIMLHATSILHQSGWEDPPGRVGGRGCVLLVGGHPPSWLGAPPALVDRWEEGFRFTTTWHTVTWHVLIP